MGYEQILAVHIMINLLVWMAIQFGFLKVHPYMSIVALLLPVLGVLLVLILHFQIFFHVTVDRLLHSQLLQNIFSR